MQTKSIWASKTLWLNVITIALGIFEVVTKTYTVSPEIIGLVNGLGNILLRMFSANEPLTIGGVRVDGKK